MDGWMDERISCFCRTMTIHSFSPLLLANNRLIISHSSIISNFVSIELQFSEANKTRILPESTSDTDIRTTFGFLYVCLWEQFDLSQSNS